MTHDKDDLWVVPAERHVERLARSGARAETRTSLRERLAATLLRELAFVDGASARLALAMALADEGALDGPAPDALPAASQLDLFGAPVAPRSRSRRSPSPPRDSAEPSVHDVLGAARRRGDATWVSTVEAIDEAITALRSQAVTPDDLDRAARASSRVTSVRARTVAAAMRALDARLKAAGAVDGRLVGTLLARAIAAAPAEDVIKVVGARRLRARWLLGWDGADLAWWRALDDTLSPRGGSARVVLPAFERRLEPTRDRDPLEILADHVSKALDAAPELELVRATLGDLAGGPDLPPQLDGVRVIRAADPVAQAAAVAKQIGDALERGVPVERIAVALPTLDERTLAPLRRAIEQARIVAHETRGPVPSQAPVVASAMFALEGASLERLAVARLLRSGYVDGFIVLSPLGEPHAIPPDAAIARMATALESYPTSAGEDAVERFVRTAIRSGAEERYARRVAMVLVAPAAARTRREHVAAARALWAELGIGARAGRGGLATFARDEPPRGVARAERLAIARDARGWAALTAAVDAYDAMSARLGASEQVISGEIFRLEIRGVLDQRGAQPGGARAASVRIARIGDLVGEEHDLVVVVDANEGILPRDATEDGLVSERVLDALARTSGGPFVGSASSVHRARELAALAVVAEGASAIVFVSLAEDASGSPLAPAAVVEALLRAGVTPTVASKEGRPAPDPDATARAERERAREAFFLDPQRETSDVVGDLTSLAVAHDLGALLGRATGAEGRALAVTSLERFAKCAFMGYAHAVLSARETELKSELPDAREEGTVMHEVLAAAFGATRVFWPLRPRDSEEILVRGLAAADLALEAWRAHAPLRAIVRLRLMDAVRTTLEAALADDDWDFALAEQAFGSKAGGWPALDLRAGPIEVLLRGTIDRVDRAHDGRAARVLDYKRSKNTARDSASGAGTTALQVPIYASVVSRQTGLPATGMYVATQARDAATSLRPSPKAAARMEELVRRTDDEPLSEIERIAVAHAIRIRSGMLAPLPIEESICRTCSVSGACRKPRFAMAPVDEADEPGA